MGNSTDADVESCGRGPGSPVMVKTGPSKSDQPQTGVCSAGCEGSRADTIGVVEFDTVNKVFVDNHNIKQGTGWGADPVASPDGKWIVLLGNDGGQNVRILSASANGESSGTNGLADVAVDFEGGTPGKTVVSDVAFIQDENREILVVGASTDNNIVLVDLTTLETRKLNLAPGVTESTGGGARYLEWAVGTDYVWVNGGESQEAYIIKIGGGIESAVVDRTLTGVSAGNMLFVNNYERMRAAALAQGIANTENTVQVSSNPTMSSSSSSTSDAAANADSSSDGMTSSSSSKASVAEEDSTSSTTGVLGIIFGALGLIAGLSALALTLQQKNAAPALETAAKQDVEQAFAVETKSLGSKQVN